MTRYSLTKTGSFFNFFQIRSLIIPDWNLLFQRVWTKKINKVVNLKLISNGNNIENKKKKYLRIVVYVYSARTKKKQIKIF